MVRSTGRFSFTSLYSRVMRQRPLLEELREWWTVVYGCPVALAADSSLRNVSQSDRDTNIRNFGGRGSSIASRPQPFALSSAKWKAAVGCGLRRLMRKLRIRGA